MTIHLGDCVQVMAGMEPDSIDAIVTDPPYGLEFMGKEWDRLETGAGYQEKPRFNEALGFGGYRKRPNYYQSGKTAQEWHERWATEALRVAKPGAYLLAFGGTRTVHRLACALEDAGWIIRDMLVWAYASGFPKSKASLKPAWEPIVLARKPGPLRMLDIDGCRIEGPMDGTWGARQLSSIGYHGTEVTEYRTEKPAGRWPANVVLTDPIFDGGWDGVVGGGETRARGNVTPTKREHSDGAWAANGSPYGIGPDGPIDPGDTGTYSRFFLIPKASRSDREPKVPGDLVMGMPDNAIDSVEQRERGTGRGSRSGPRRNTHPTVKSTALMRHLVRLVTPQGGTVLDPFLGSGSTVLAATLEGFAWVGIEREAAYVRIAEQRLEQAQQGLGLA